MPHTFQVCLESIRVPLEVSGVLCREFCGVLFPKLFRSSLKPGFVFLRPRPVWRPQALFSEVQGKKAWVLGAFLGKSSTESRHIYPKQTVSERAANWLAWFYRQNGQPPNAISVFQRTVVFSFRNAWATVFVISFFSEGLLSGRFSRHEKERKQVTE